MRKSPDLVRQSPKIRRAGWAPLMPVLGWLRRQPLAFNAGLLLMALISAVTFIGPLLYRTSPYTIDPIYQLVAPSGHFPLGTDQIGRDELARLISGGQASLLIGFTASFVAIALGMAYGLLAGLAPRFGDAALMRLLDALLSVPTVVILIFLASLYTLTDPVLILLLGCTSWPRTARVVRNETLSARSRDFVTASRQFGAGLFFIARTHIVRTILPILVVNFVFLVADNILALSFLSFLGLGVQPPVPTWGNLLFDGMNNLFSNAWWLIYPAGLMIFLSVVAVNLIGEGVISGMERS
ncbi:MAG TPA: ABC transporter permease [Chloroflexota bacterium]|nr:ABC transporter permease [Chloroflexota bacterium]